MKTLLLDADPLVYALGHTAEITDIPLEIYYEYRVSTSVCNYMGALSDEVKCRLFLTDGANNFRNEIAVTYPYKGNRPKDGKPVHYDLIREVMVDRFGAFVSYEEEADDRISILNRQLPNAVIGSNDKDFLTQPGEHLRLHRNKPFELLTVTPEQATEFFWIQVLTGDTTDNIIGIKGIGPVKAKKILKDCDTEEDYYLTSVEQYADAGMSVDRLIENCQLLHLRTIEGEIWSPPL